MITRRIHAYVIDGFTHEPIHVNEPINNQSHCFMDVPTQLLEPIAAECHGSLLTARGTPLSANIRVMSEALEARVSYRDVMLVKVSGVYIRAHTTMYKVRAGGHDTRKLNYFLQPLIIKSDKKPT